MWMTRKSIALTLISALISALLLAACANIPGFAPATPTALPQPSDLPPLDATPGAEVATESPELKSGDTPTDEATEDTGEDTDEDTEEVSEEPTDVPELDTIYSD